MGNFVQDVLSASKVKEAASYSCLLWCLNIHLLIAAVSAMSIIAGLMQRFNVVA